MPDTRTKPRNRFLLTALFCLLMAGALLPMPAAAAAAPPARIVSLAPSLTEILYDLGVENRIVAVTDYCDYPPGAKTKPKVGGFVNPSLEAIAALNPDAVVMTEDGNPQALERRLKALGIRTHIFKARRIRELPQEIRTIGAVLGIETTANRRADRIEADLRRIGEKGTAARRRVQKALFVVQPAPLMVAGQGTTIDDAFRILRIDNIAATEKTGYPKFSLEEIVRRDPDALFFGKGRGMEGRVKPLIEKLGALDAVQAGRVFFVGDGILRLGPRIISSIEEIAACIDAR